jgi:heme oxygenase
MPALDHVEEPAILDALRAATRSRHAMLGRSVAMVRLFEATYTIAEYRAHLGDLLGLFASVEAAASRVATPEDPAPIRRSLDLRDDLATMGVTSACIDRLGEARIRVDFPAGGLRGFTYVVLGSMLGGRLIVKHLRTVLGPSASLQFYGAGGAGSIALWDAFCADLATARNADVRAICATASAVFDVYADSLSKHRHVSGGA